MTVGFQVFHEAWIAVGGKRHVVTKQCGVHFSGGTDLRTLVEVLNEKQTQNQYRQGQYGAQTGPEIASEVATETTAQITTECAAQAAGLQSQCAARAIAQDGWSLFLLCRCRSFCILHQF